MLGISKSEKMTLINKKINHEGRLPYLGSIIIKASGCLEDFKNKIPKAHGVFNTLKKIWKNRNVIM